MLKYIVSLDVKGKALEKLLQSLPQHGLQAKLANKSFFTKKLQMLFFKFVTLNRSPTGKKKRYKHHLLPCWHRIMNRTGSTYNNFNRSLAQGFFDWAQQVTDGKFNCFLLLMK